MIKLLASIKYELNDPLVKNTVNQIPSDDPDMNIDLACLLYKEGRYDEAIAKFQESMRLVEFQPELAYNIALCSFRLGQYGKAQKLVTEIIDRGSKEHPELLPAAIHDGEERSVGNSLALHQTFLVEAFNLRAAIEYQLKHCM